MISSGRLLNAAFLFYFLEEKKEGHEAAEKEGLKKKKKEKQEAEKKADDSIAAVICLFLCLFLSKKESPAFHARCGPNTLRTHSAHTPHTRNGTKFLKKKNEIERRRKSR